MTEEQLLALAICATNHARPPCLRACAWCLHEARADLAALDPPQARGPGQAEQRGARA